jgi:carbon monoxide dehydrogenase subunit G
MAEGAVDVTIDAPPDAVWAKIGDFGGLGEVFPGLESCRLEGDVRIISVAGHEVREQLLSRDEAARTLTYSVIAGVPVDRHVATITVDPQGMDPR